jgi:hypothetical protein
VTRAMVVAVAKTEHRYVVTKQRSLR